MFKCKLQRSTLNKVLKTRIIIFNITSKTLSAFEKLLSFHYCFAYKMYNINRFQLQAAAQANEL